MNYEERKKWFSDRVGKIVHRNRNGCDCSVCKGIYQKGLLLIDKQHAIYAFDMEGESWLDNEIGIKYFDTKDEVKEFERTLKR